MSADNSCGDQSWFHERIYGIDGVSNPYEKAAVDQDKLEIERLSREILKLQSDALTRLATDLDEESMREDNPAVKDAWDKYQTVLRLATK